MSSELLLGRRRCSQPRWGGCSAYCLVLYRGSLPPPDSASRNSSPLFPLVDLHLRFSCAVFPLPRAIHFFARLLQDTCLIPFGGSLTLLFGIFTLYHVSFVLVESYHHSCTSYFYRHLTTSRHKLAFINIFCVALGRPSNTLHRQFCLLFSLIDIQSYFLQF